MYDICASIKNKYECKSAPDDWPEYGDTVDFIDELNGNHLRGVVVSHHWLSPVGGYRSSIWNVDVGTITSCVVSMKYSEIKQITRR